MIQFVVFIFVISHSKQFQVAVYDRIETFHFTFVGLFYSELMASWGEEKNLLRHRLHSESFTQKLTVSFFLFFNYRLKREEGGGSIIIQAMAQPQQLQQQNIQQQSMDSRPMDHDEKKMRRQIANSNERRRMQSINAGFQSLRQLLPHHEGEKLSKVSR